VSRLFLIAVCALAITGCGETSDESEAGPKSAYLNLEKKLVAGDSSACSMMSSDYKNKLAASVQLFAADCPEVVKDVQKGFKEDPDLRTKSIDQVRVKGDTATFIARSTYDGQDVRTKVYLKRGPEDAWILDKDAILDAAGPPGPLIAFREYSYALRKADGERVCALSTARGKELMARVVPESHGSGQCEGAVPFVAVAASKQPRPEVIGGDEESETAQLYALQSDGDGIWAFQVIGMEREDGQWLFDYSRELGRAPAPRAPSSPVT
jgi:hypothetical protein